MGEGWRCGCRVVRVRGGWGVMGWNLELFGRTGGVVERGCICVVGGGWWLLLGSCWEIRQGCDEGYQIGRLQLGG